MTLDYHDTFQPRPFQQAIKDAVLDGMESGRRVTVVEASPGSGKTLAYQSVLTALWRLKLIDYGAVFVPRLTLARQCEIEWMTRKTDQATRVERWDGDHRHFDARRRFGLIRHIPNKTPLLEPGALGVGFVQTYDSLVEGVYDEGGRSSKYEDWAREHRGRFLLVADEAQFCGARTEKGGTKAGAEIEKLSRFAAHTLLLTGTAYRADGTPLVLADYTEPDEQGVCRVVSHASSTYADGVAEGYLRGFEAQMTQIRARRRYLDNVAVEYDVSNDGTDLREALRMRDTWEPLVARVAESLMEKKRINPKYRALISCMEQSDARKVEEFLIREYPNLKTRIAITEDPRARSTLDEFKVDGGGDILVTVRMAFIGYNCPEITVVGVLTHVRDPGHLMQLIGRGLRVWSGAGAEQSCRVITPDDPKMNEFITFMRGQSEQGLRRRAIRCDLDPDGGRLPGEKHDEALYVVESARATTTRGVSNDAELGAEDWHLIEAIKHNAGSVDDVTTLARVIEMAGIRLRDMQPPPLDEAPSVIAATGEAPMTEEQRLKQINVETQDAIKAHLAKRGVHPRGSSDYGDQIRRETNLVNRMAGLKSDDVRSVDGALSRLRAARELGRESVS